jgi:uncharacterized membrane protein YkvA (DUF1232 family)
MIRLLRAVPALLRMLAGLIRDPALPRGAKIALVAAAVYLASPIDLVPDALPILGYIDDVLLSAIILDGVLNLVNRELLLRHWPRGERSLDVLARAARTLVAWIPQSVRKRIFSAAR